MIWPLLLFLSACASLPNSTTSHWNYQLSNYNKRFEKLMSMSHNAIWVLNPNTFTQQQIKKYSNNQNIMLAHMKTTDLKNDLIKAHKLGFHGAYIQLNQYQFHKSNNVNREQEDLKNVIQILSKFRPSNFLVYIANPPLNIADMDKNLLASYLKAIDGVSMESIFFKIKTIKDKKLQQAVATNIQLHHQHKKQVLSVEYTASLEMMNQYKKYIKNQRMMGLITDSKLRGLSFLHFTQ